MFQSLRVCCDPLVTLQMNGRICLRIRRWIRQNRLTASLFGHVLMG
jgi:hypothetical protein